ncbi:serpin family protein [Streptomyces sp. NPDC093089]|uniref:serpin family protein n=1 Tax=Streptomyces sp. NPDC093089 TaxID=3366024 RepID=UPI00380BDC3A
MTTRGPADFPAHAIGALAARWIPRLGDDDFVVSPVGLWLALGAVASGARGATAKEFGQLLGVEGEAAAEAVTLVGRRLAASGGVAVATGVWSTVPVLPSFERGLPGVRFGVLPGAVRGALPEGVLGAADGVSPEEVPDAQGELDAWVREATGGRIERLPLDLDGSEDLVLLNALALKASWLTAFDGRLTREEPFTDGYGDTWRVPTMRKRIPAAWAWTVGRVTVVELPCAGEGGAGPVVRFVLGADGDGLGEALPAAWAGPGERRAFAAESVDLALPRFTLRTKTDAKGQLAALGLDRAMRPEADFSGLSAADLFVDKVVQEAVVEVAEEGVEAAAVTQVTMTRGAAPPRHGVVERIAFDRPFGVVVLDGEGGAPLFAGWRSSAPFDGSARRA